jgi:hypothetical protein
MFIRTSLVAASFAALALAAACLFISPARSEPSLRAAPPPTPSLTLIEESLYGPPLPNGTPEWRGNHFAITGPTYTWVDLHVRAWIDWAALDDVIEGHFVDVFGPDLKASLTQSQSTTDDLDAEELAAKGIIVADTQCPIAVEPDVLQASLLYVVDGPYEDVRIPKRFQPILAVAEGGPPPQREWRCETLLWSSYAASAGRLWKPLKLGHATQTSFAPTSLFSTYLLMAYGFSQQATAEQSNAFFNQKIPGTETVWARGLIMSQVLSIDVQAIGLNYQLTPPNFAHWFDEANLATENPIDRVPLRLLVTDVMTLHITAPRPLMNGGTGAIAVIPGGLLNLGVDGFCGPFTAVVEDSASVLHTLTAQWAGAGRVKFPVPENVATGPAALISLTNPVATTAYGQSTPVPIIVNP